MLNLIFVNGKVMQYNKEIHLIVDCLCVYMLSFIEGVHFFQESSNNGREWVFYALSEYSKLKTQTNKNHIDKTNGLILNDKGIHKIKLRENEELEDPQ